MSGHSSTSNSNDRLPADSWGRTWALAILLFAAALAGFEFHFSRQGFTPSLADDAGLWCLTRSRMVPNDPGTVALVGSSRMQEGVRAATLSESGSRQAFQLAVSGSVCLPVLEHLSQDPGFVGTVICEVLPGLLSDKAHVPFASRQGEYVQRYERRSAYDSFEQHLRMALQSTLVSRLPELGVSSLARSLLGGKWPQPAGYREFLPDRCVCEDFSRASSQRLEYGQTPDPGRTPMAAEVVPETVSRTLDQLESCVARIQARGGRVVFLRMPSSGEMYLRDEERFPRAAEWDLLAARTRARCIHFRDDPLLAEYSCPDGSHLDARDAPGFTRRLAEIAFGEPAAKSATPAGGR